MATVEQLYKDFGVLADAKEKASEHEKEYLSILSAVQGGPSEKRLASQFIARFFKYFPNQAEQAIDAQLDLCEDTDTSIRKQAIKDLPSLCKDKVEYVPRIGDALSQLLQTNDASEFSLVQSSLLNLLKMDPKGTLSGLFSQILNGDELVRERCIKFMSTKMKTLQEDVLTKEVEDYLVAESKKVLVDVTGDEFVTFMTILSGLKTTSTVQGRQQLVEVVTEQADLESPFEHADPDCVDRLVQCVKQALPLFSKNVHSTRFVTYMCDNVLPVMSELAAPEVPVAEGENTTSDIQLDVLKLLAELSTHMGDVDNISELTGKVFEKLLGYMPLPPPTENGENITPSEEPKLQFSNVECLMYTFHEMSRKCPEFLTGDEHAERLKDFRIRLQYFARGLQLYIKQLRLALQGKTGDALKTEENKIKVIALKITNNINILIKDLFHNPPAYKNTVSLSWKPLTKASTAQVTSPTAGQKRAGITPITYESDGTKKVSKQDRSLYSPPTGKFSEKAGNYAAGNRGGRGGRGRGGHARGGRRGWRGRRW